MTKKHYAAYLTVTLPDGVKKQLKFYGSTQKEANAKRDEAKVLNERGLLTFNNKTPLRRYAEEYHKTYVAPNYDKINARQMWKRFEAVFLDTLGNMAISAIKPVHLVRCLNTTVGKSKSYYDNVFSYAKNLFRAAVADDLIVKNPMDGIKKESRESKKGRALTDIEREAVLRILSTDTKYAFFAVMLGCGLRPGEVQALAWSCVDFERQEITVTQNKKADGSIGSPKTKSGYRTIPMPLFLVNILKKLPRTGTLVFSGQYKRLWKRFRCDLHNQNGGKYTLRGEHNICADGIGSDLIPYYLRHTFATMMAEAGVPIKVAQKYMGHADASMLMKIYSHVSEKLEQQAREKMATMFVV